MQVHRFLLRDLPPGLEPLAELATDLRWTWSHAGDAVWNTIDPQAWEQTENPFVVLQNVTRERLDELNKDPAFKEQLGGLVVAREEYCSRTGWFGETHADTHLKRVAYFCLEFGLGEALPLYAGGLGVLAGDYLKAASDLAVPVVAVGLLYQEGYFRQMLDSMGQQQAVYPYNAPTNLPIRPVQAASGAWLYVTSDLPGRAVRFRIWQAQVGRVTLYLLDSNDPLNSPYDRGITSKLYGGGQEMRLVQEIALGICGWRLIETLGLEVDVCHLNEGHAAFVTLERARCFMEESGLDFWEALWATRAGNVFTTHTPVTAGFDTFDPQLLLKYGQVYAERLGVTPDELGALGRKDSDDHNEPFNMAYLAARTCGTINGVSRLHGEVSREIFQVLYPRWPRCEVPVIYITNGVHVPSWDSPWADEAWTRVAGKERWRSGLEGLARAILEDISDEELWSFCGRERADLVDYLRMRLARQLSQRGEAPEMATQLQHILDPNVLTLGFARRFAEYKRPNLLLRDPERLIRLLNHPNHPVQLVVAGKAHPQDETGKRFVQEWDRFTQRPEVRFHAVFLEDYDMALAQKLVQGVDVWINTPRRPWEACGTSGMKVLANGGLNLSELDGWWAEAYTPEVGWALGDGAKHLEPGWDAVEAEQLYRLLEEQVVPLFYARDAVGIPRTWVARVRASMASLAPQFSTNRMMREYVDRLYVPAAAAFQRRTAQKGRLARELRGWELALAHHWQDVRWGNLEVREEAGSWRFEIQLYLGEISPDLVQVQLYVEPVNGEEPVCQPMERGESIPGAMNGYLYTGEVSGARPPDHYTPRVIPGHPAANVPVEMNLILWWPGVPVASD